MRTKHVFAFAFAVGCGKVASTPFSDVPPITGSQEDAGTESVPEVDGAVEAMTAPPPPDPVAELANVAPACAGGWCWRYPNIQGNRLTRAFATAADNLWLGGGRGFLMQWDGIAWRQRALPAAPFPASQNIEAIGGTSPQDVWIATGVLLYHWDGTSFTLRESFAPEVDQRFGQVWVAPGGDVWVGADYGIVFRSKGGTAPFQAINTNTPQAGTLGPIWGLADDDFWIGARPGVLMHCDGTNFNVVPTNSFKTIQTVWGVAKNDVWAGGLDGILFHWNGTELSPVPSGTTQSITQIRGRSANDVWMLGSANSLKSIQLHWDGTLAAIPNPFEAPGGRLNPMDIAQAGERLWAPAEGSSIYVHEIATGWKQVHAPARAKTNGIWGRANDDLWTGGSEGIQHWNGKAWTDVPLLGAPGGINGMTGTYDPDHLDVWAAAGSAREGKVTHFDGTAWTVTAFPGETFYGAWAPTIGEVFVVGAKGMVRRFANGAWSVLDAGTTTLEIHGAWGPSPDLVWMVGDQGKIWKWQRSNPTVLTPEPSPTTRTLFAIHGYGETAWIAGSAVVLRNSGSGFAPVTLPAGTMDLHAVFARSATDVYVGGSNGQVFHFDGITFKLEDPRVEDTINALWAAPGSNVWATTATAALEKKGP